MHKEHDVCVGGWMCKGNTLCVLQDSVKFLTKIKRESMCYRERERERERKRMCVKEREEEEIF